MQAPQSQSPSDKQVLGTQPRAELFGWQVLLIGHGTSVQEGIAHPRLSALAAPTWQRLSLGQV
jgi:hypothetical protein